MLDFFFGFDGCFNRTQYWKAFFVAFLLFFAALLPILLLSLNTPGPELTDTFLSDGYFENQRARTNFLTNTFYFSIPLFGLPVWVHAAATVKRYHDLNKSGYAYFRIAIPIIGWWQIIECGFFEGVYYKNRFRF